MKKHVEPEVSQRSPQREPSVNKKAKKYWTRRLVFILSVVVLVALVAVVNITFSLLSKNYPALTIDLTSAKLFQLSPGTTDMLSQLESPVTIQVLAKEEAFAGVSSYNQQANQILHLFEKQSPNIQLSYVDYIKNPTFSAGYPELNIKHGDILVSSGEKYQLVATEELFNYATGAAGTPVIASSKAEEAIITAIASVTSQQKKTVLVTTGHQEYAMESFNQLLKNNGYELKAQNLVTDKIAKENDIIMIVAPKADFTSQEIDQLEAYFINDGDYGKTVFYCGDADQPVLPMLEGFIAQWGVKINDGAVFETMENRVYNYHPFYAVADYSEEYYSGLTSTVAKPMLMPVSRPLSVDFEYRNNYSTQILLEFAATAGVRPSASGEEFVADDAEVWGPIPAMVLSSYSFTPKNSSLKKQSYLLVSGSTGAMDSYAVDNYSLNNSEYLLKLLGALIKSDDVILIPPKSFTGTALGINQNTANIIGTLFMLGIPLIILAVGLTVWLRRRHT